MTRNTPTNHEIKDCWQLSEAINRRDKEGIFSGNIRESMILPTPWFWTFSLQNWETLNVYCFKLVSGTCYSNPWKLIQPLKSNCSNYYLLIIYSVYSACKHFALFILSKYKSYESPTKMRKVKLPLVIVKEYQRSFRGRRSLRHLRINRKLSIDFSRQTIRSWGLSGEKHIHCFNSLKN